MGPRFDLGVFKFWEKLTFFYEKFDIFYEKIEIFYEKIGNGKQVAWDEKIFTFLMKKMQKKSKKITACSWLQLSLYVLMCKCILYVLGETAKQPWGIWNGINNIHSSQLTTNPFNLGVLTSSGSGSNVSLLLKLLCLRESIKSSFWMRPIVWRKVHNKHYEELWKFTVLQHALHLHVTNPRK